MLQNGQDAKVTQSSVYRQCCLGAKEHRCAKFGVVHYAAPRRDASPPLEGHRSAGQLRCQTRPIAQALADTAKLALLAAAPRVHAAGAGQRDAVVSACDGNGRSTSHHIANLA